MNERVQDEMHLDAGTVAAYLDRQLDAGERERVREHLADCDRCRAEMIEVTEAVDSIAKRPRRWWTVPAAAAAAVAALLLIGGPLMRSADQGDVLRAPGQSRLPLDTEEITAVTPPPGSVITPSELVFAWNAVGNAIYRVTLTDAGGDPLWSGETRGTTTLLPSRVVLEPGTTYLWYVDALLPDGRTVTTGVRRFETAP